MPDWSSEWPQKEGKYWVYGYPSHMRTQPRLELADVRHAGSEPHKFWMYSWRGGFLDESEAMLLWTPADVPEPPPAEMLAAIPDPLPPKS
jgi:hypothetical protein